MAIISNAVSCGGIGGFFFFFPWGEWENVEEGGKKGVEDTEKT